MNLSSKWVTVLKRFARTLGAILIAALIVKLPDLIGVFNLDASLQIWILGFLTPLLVAADKWIRFTDNPPVPVPVPPPTLK